MIKIAPSILSANFAYLADDVKKVTNAGAEYIHIDVMDGSFVPNITIGSPVIKCLRNESAAIFDVHLMVEHPETQVEACAKAGADIITFHIETAPHAHRIIQQIKKAGCMAGIAINPGTSISSIEELIDDVDMILVMTVNPGFGGQKFIRSTLKKIRLLREIINTRNLHIDIEVDGGINVDTAPMVKEAGANVLVAGSAIYCADDINKAIKDIRG